MKYAIGLLIVLTLTACETPDIANKDRLALSNEQLSAERSALISAPKVHVLWDNQLAFEKKLELIRNAKQSIDLIYPEALNDYSSAMLARTLIGAADRGVDVQLLVDFNATYPTLDYFSMLEHWGNQSEGSLRVRLFNGPAANVLADALLIETCYQNNNECTKEQQEQIQAQAAKGHLTIQAKRFLAGFYGHDMALQALALEAQWVDKDQLGQRYFNRQFTKNEQAAARQLSLKLLDNANLAVSTPDLTGVNDKTLSPIWQYATRVLGHAWLISDKKTLQMGRALRDAYHISEGPLAEPSSYRSVDLVFSLKDPIPEFDAAIQALWRSPYTITLHEVRNMLPNDEVYALAQARNLCQSDDDLSCLVTSYLRLIEQPLSERIFEQYETMQANALSYDEDERFTNAKAWPVDASSQWHYLENLPLKANKDGVFEPSWESINDQEAAHHKMIHSTWLSSLRALCAAKDGNRSIMIRTDNALMPANLLAELAQMIDGRIPCSGVTLDLIVNQASARVPSSMLSQYSLNALLSHQSNQGDLPTGMRLRYFEDTTEQPFSGTIALFGDDVYVGTSATWIRNFMVNTGAGFWIQLAPNFNQRLREEFTHHIQDKSWANKTQSLANSGASSLQQEHRRLIDLYISDYSLGRMATPNQIQQLKTAFNEMSDKLNALSQAIVRHYSDSKEEQKEYNRLFLYY